MKDILFISDGYGEDTIAAYIIASLNKKVGEISIKAFPLVGTGKNYENLNITLTGPRKEMPSGGDLHSSGRIVGDIQAGLPALLWQQWSFLKTLKNSVSPIVAVGDIYPVIMAVLAGLEPIVFVGTAKSNWYYPYSFIEKYILKKFCKLVFVRDIPTSKDLENSGINSAASNTMMDCFEISGEDFGFNNSDIVIGILPGSREVAYKDFPVILNAVEYLYELKQEKVKYIAALSPSIEAGKLSNSAEGWNYVEVENYKTGVIAYLEKEDGLKINFTNHCFGDVINRANIVIGQAGTGNEQAAGLGKPVVSFDSGRKKKPGWYRARQKGLLGGSLSVVDSNGETIAREVISILENKEKMEKMARIGRERMGKKGAINKITDHIVDLLDL